MTDYLGSNVLEQRSNAREMPSDSLHRDLFISDPGTGKRVVHARDLSPRVTRPYLWTCQSRAEIKALKDWLDVRCGRLVPFWVPTWRRDLLLSSPVAAADISIGVQYCGYTQYQFPATARRHLAFVPASGVPIYRSVISATGGSGVEALGLSASLGVVFPMTGLVSFLTLCRLAADDVVINYFTDSIAEASLQFIEIPEEAP